MKTIAIIGAAGQLGQYLVEVFEESTLDVDIISLTRQEMDLSDSIAIENGLSDKKPDLIINASAYTAVDKAESEPDLAMLINATAPAAMAKYASDNEVPLIHYSTDYVFAGDQSSPYQTDFPTSPQGEYGRTKLAGEQAVLACASQAYIFRTAWVYSNKGGNFYKTMLRLAESRDELNIVNDQIGSPTYARSIAVATLVVVKKLLACDSLEDMQDKYPAGVYHMTSEGQTCWADFAREIFHLHDLNVSVIGISTSEYPTPAKRPAYSVLDNQTLYDVFAIKMPDWKQALLECFKEKVD